MKSLILQIAKFGVGNAEQLNDVYGGDLHHELFNMNHFITNDLEAKRFLNKYDVFEAIEKVTKYEKDQFGEITTDISNPGKLVNMLAYVIGEELMQESETLQRKWDDRLTNKEIKKVCREMIKAVK